MDKYEITQREYEQVMGKNPSRFKGSDRPVENVTWFEADGYCRKVGKRLPAEWEWEKAAKAGTTTTYYWGESEKMADSYAWYDENSGGKTHPVGQKKPNDYGLYDMAGNVWEWTSSDYDDSGKYKTLSGGSWFTDANYVRPSYRDFLTSGNRIYASGFRCAQHPPNNIVSAGIRQFTDCRSVPLGDTWCPIPALSAEICRQPNIKKDSLG